MIMEESVGGDSNEFVISIELLGEMIQVDYVATFIRMGWNHQLGLVITELMVVH